MSKKTVVELVEEDDNSQPTCITQPFETDSMALKSSYHSPPQPDIYDNFPPPMSGDIEFDDQDDDEDMYGPDILEDQEMFNLSSSRYYSDNEGDYEEGLQYSPGTPELIELGDDDVEVPAYSDGQSSGHDTVHTFSRTLSVASEDSDYQQPSLETTVGNMGIIKSTLNSPSLIANELSGAVETNPDVHDAPLVEIQNYSIPLEHENEVLKDIRPIEDPVVDELPVIDDVYDSVSDPTALTIATSNVLSLCQSSAQPCLVNAAHLNELPLPEPILKVVCLPSALCNLLDTAPLPEYAVDLDNELQLIEKSPKPRDLPSPIHATESSMSFDLMHDVFVKKPIGSNDRVVNEETLSLKRSSLPSDNNNAKVSKCSKNDKRAKLDGINVLPFEQKKWMIKQNARFVNRPVNMNGSSKLEDCCQEDMFTIFEIVIETLKKYVVKSSKVRPQNCNALKKAFDKIVLKMDKEMHYLSSDHFYKDLEEPLKLYKNPQEQKKRAKAIIDEANRCVDCVINWCFFEEEFFAQPCRNAHTIVWAKVGHGGYWPAKVIEINKQYVHLKFFGDKHQTATVRRSACLMVTENFARPDDSDQGTKLQLAIDEMKRYVEIIKDKFKTCQVFGKDGQVLEAHQTYMVMTYSSEESLIKECLHNKLTVVIRNIRTCT